MRTFDEVVAHYREVQEQDPLTRMFASEVLLSYLPAEHLKGLVSGEADLTDWEPYPLTREQVLEEMRSYMEFAWSKVINHRGISANRSVIKMGVWLWLLGDDELCEFVKDRRNFPQYGAPILARICEKYRFSLPDADGVWNMAIGRPCRPNCDMGCAV